MPQKYASDNLTLHLILEVKRNLGLPGTISLEVYSKENWIWMLISVKHSNYLLLSISNSDWTLKICLI